MENAHLIAKILEDWKNDYNDNADNKCIVSIINLLNKEVGKIKKEKLDFTDWFCHSGYIMRPFPEESGVYLFDNHSVEDLEELYENPKTLNELYNIFEQNKKQNE